MRLLPRTFTAHWRLGALLAYAVAAWLGFSSLGQSGDEAKRLEALRAAALCSGEPGGGRTLQPSLNGAHNGLRFIPPTRRE